MRRFSVPLSIVSLACTGAAALFLPQVAQAQSSYQYVELKPTTSTTPSPAAIDTLYGLYVNNSGKVAGLAHVKVGASFSLWALKSVDIYNDLPTVWSTSGVPTQLGLGADKKSLAHAVYGLNNSGQVVGASPNPARVPTLWSSTGKRSVLDTRMGDARAINDAGTVVGTIRGTASAANADPYRATLWRNGTPTDLHAQLGLSESQNSVATSINAQGAIGMEINGGQQCLVLQNGNVLKLEKPDDQTCAVARVADDGRVYGRLIYINGTPESLTKVGDPPAVWTQGKLSALPTQPYPYPFSAPVADPGTVAVIKSVNASGVATGFDGSGPVTWRNGLEVPFTTPVSGLPPINGYQIGSISAISDNGKMVVCLGNSGSLNCGLLVPKP
jgi:uncharacterized membrane protein